ncbi:RAMP superfamily CRISPR-associated protein [Spirulina sp. CS-785/01]|uniref:RAMP superfamily CRISPR-associated protein n=1 Tax=Spirulina sp. CS-785/01 TaxID=3021716 RepID=UPI00232BEBD4|nr:RAMP superfamily CRISPR-associated protein [Spirulina sp. CS-785/01]MDB9313720.1 RAMP superfamily CRISPR-associated protein [Spirulina sp. CS-785/01]
MVYERPKRPNKPSKATKKPPTPPTKKVISKGGKNAPRNKSGGRQGGNGGNNNTPPSPWLDPDNEPSPHETASFVEYLRWMREPDRDNYKDGTKVEILQQATENANYRQRLATLSKRTERIAGKNNTFQVKCPWRIRVGGHRGPESILLPAFDALGMPYIPSSTLRGVARTQAIRELMAKNPQLNWKQAQDHPNIAKYFGSLEAGDADKAGKIVFLDAYPIPSQTGGLTMDIANNIWSWEGNDLNYSPNPNPFLSLKETTFLIGLRLTSRCEDAALLEPVKTWLIQGLQSGIGSQVNTGYGDLLKAGVGQPTDEFFRVDFSLEGQLIHGYQRFTQWRWNDRRHEWQMRGQAQAEVRPTAFKSMLRYWFRAFALGVLTPQQVSTWEAQLFGGINPKKYGYLKVSLLNGRIAQKEPRPNYKGQNDPCGEQQGTLVLSFSPETPNDQETQLKTLLKNLTWLLFNLGGIGQGARRPCYSRQNRDRAPWYRGSTFYIELEEADPFWEAPEQISAFKKTFQQRLKAFYQALGQLTSQNLDYNHRTNNFPVHQDTWTDAVDRNCEIIICNGRERNDKPYALNILHSPQFKIKRGSREDYDGNLCGKVVKGVQPSPVWIADLGDYQVVTVFGATQNPRRQYVEELSNQTSAKNYATVFPLP